MEARVPGLCRGGLATGRGWAQKSVEVPSLGMMVDPSCSSLGLPRLALHPPILSVSLPPSGTVTMLLESSDHVGNGSNRGDTMWFRHVLHRNARRSCACSEERRGVRCGPPWLCSGLLVLDHLLVGGRRCAAVGRRGRVSHAALGRVRLHLESHCHVPNRIHAWSSRVSVVGRPQLLGSWKVRGQCVSTNGTLIAPWALPSHLLSEHTSRTLED